MLLFHDALFHPQFLPCSSSNSTSAQSPSLPVQAPEVVHDLSFMSLTVPSAASEAAGREPEVVQMAPPGAPHGRFAAFSAAPRVVTAVTATTKELSMRPGRHVFADE